jgi:hypothetical protein
MALFGIKEGLKIFGSEANADVINGTSNPSQGAGIAAPQGSLYLKSDGVSYKKTGPADTDWQPYSEIEGGGLLWSTISGATTAEVSRGYVLDSSSAEFTVTLPAAPEVGDTVGFAGLGDIETNNITVDLNGLNMNGSGDDLIIDLNYCYFEMLYTGDATTGWVLSNTDESGNVDNIQAFIGNDDNTDAAVTEFTEENYIVSGDSLEDAIDKLDMALNDSDATASGLGVDLSALDARVTVNEGDIDTAQADIITNANNITTNSGNIATNAADIVTLEGEMDTAQADIITNANNITTNSGNIATNASDITALEAYTGSAGASSPDYNQENYIADGDSLEEAISKLDAALLVIDNLAATGVNWQQTATAITADVVSTSVGAYSGTDHFSDDDTPFWTHDDWADGARIVSMNATTSGMIYTWDDGADQWVYDSQLGANDAIAVQYDFPDAPGSQEDGAAYMMKSDSSGLIKIADFDLETAASIAISSGYTATSGTISSADSVESAIEKLDWRSADSASDLSALEARVTVNEGDIDTAQADILTNAADIAVVSGTADTNASNIATNVINIATNASDIATVSGRVDTNETDIDDLEAAVGSATGLAGMDYTSTDYVTVDTSVVAAISALDAALASTDATVSGLGVTTSDNYTYITNVDTAHDNLAAAVLTEATTSVSASSSATVLDTVPQSGNLGAKWFVIAYDGSGNRYAAEIYAMHDGTTSADLTEYAILTIGTSLDLTFDVSANGTNMSLTVDNGDTSPVTVKTQRITVQTASVDTTAVLS